MAALQDTLTMLESAQNELQEAVYALRHYQQKLDADPQRLREQEQRHGRRGGSGAQIPRDTGAVAASIAWHRGAAG